MNFFLFQIFPYIAIASFIGGSILRFDRDPYSWRSKSSQLLRRKQLILGSVLFHLGILIVLGAKQILAMTAGGIAGFFCLIGLLMLLHRRLFDPRIRATSSFSDIAVLVLLLAQLLLGLYSITESMKHLDGHVMVQFMEWAQHIATFRGGAHEYVSDVALVFKLHLTFGMFILLIFPFTRLVHAFSAPIGFVFRPYQIVRKRER